MMILLLILTIVNNNLSKYFINLNKNQIYETRYSRIPVSFPPIAFLFYKPIKCLPYVTF